MKLKLGVVATDCRSVTSPVAPAGVPAGMAPLVSPMGTTLWLHSVVSSMIEWKYMNGSCRVVYPSDVAAAVVGSLLPRGGWLHVTLPSRAGLFPMSSW